MSIEDNKLKNILEAALMAVGKPMTIEQLMKLFEEEERPSATRVKEALVQLQADCEGRGIELKDIASGYRYQARQDYSDWLSRLWEEKPPKYSRAYLETLALIAYRQPVTRAEIEEVRGVSVSSNIVKTMLEREWIRVVGHRDVPGRPSLYATTKQFLDYFNMKSLDELPSLAEIRDLEELSPELALPEPGQEDSGQDDPSANAETESPGEEATASDDSEDGTEQVDASTLVEFQDEALLEEDTEDEHDLDDADDVENPFEESAFEQESHVEFSDLESSDFDDDGPMDTESDASNSESASIEDTINEEPEIEEPEIEESESETLSTDDESLR